MDAFIFAEGNFPDMIHFLVRDAKLEELDTEAGADVVSLLFGRHFTWPLAALAPLELREVFEVVAVLFFFYLVACL